MAKVGLSKCLIVVSGILVLATLNSGCKTKKGSGSPNSPSPVERGSNEETTLGEVPNTQIQIPANNNGAVQSVEVLTTATILNCQGKNAELDNTALIFFELAEFDKDLKPISGPANVADYLSKALRAFKRFAPLEAAEIESALLEVQKSPRQSLTSVFAKDMNWIPNDCALTPVAAMYRDQSGLKFLVDESKLDALSPLNQAGIFLQMALSKVAQLRNAENFLGSRRVARLLLSNWKSSFEETVKLLAFLHPLPYFEIPQLAGDVIFAPYADFYFQESVVPEDYYRVLAACGYNLKSGQQDRTRCEEKNPRGTYVISTQFGQRVISIYDREKDKIVWQLPPQELGLPSFVANYEIKMDDSRTPIRSSRLGYYISIQTNAPTRLDYGNHSYTCLSGSWIHYEMSISQIRQEKIDLKKSSWRSCEDWKSKDLLKFRLGGKSIEVEAGKSWDGTYKINGPKETLLSVDLNLVKLNLPSGTYINFFNNGEIIFRFPETSDGNLQSTIEVDGCTIILKEASSLGTIKGLIKNKCTLGSKSWSASLQSETRVEVNSKTNHIASWGPYSGYLSVKLAGQTVYADHVEFSESLDPVVLSISMYPEKGKTPVFYSHTSRVGKPAEIKKISIDEFSDHGYDHVRICYHRGENKLYVLYAPDSYGTYDNETDMNTCQKIQEQK